LEVTDLIGGEISVSTGEFGKAGHSVLPRNRVVDQPALKPIRRSLSERPSSM
jgi:hypothetical protein